MTWRKALRIIHVSDPHVAHCAAWQRRPLERFLARWLPRPAANLIKGSLAGHDPAALAYFRVSAQEALAADDWEENHLVVTGDLTTWGDAPTLAFALQAWRDEATTLGVQGPHVIYGNHDVWLDDFPLFVPAQALDQHRTALHTVPPFQCVSPVNHHNATAAPASLWSLNTVLHDPINNALALGEVREHAYWEQLPGAHQLAALGRAGPGAVRVVLTHHPVAGAHSHLLPWMGLVDGPVVAAALDQPQMAGRWPLASVVLSGHTHTVFPKPGALEQTYGGATRPPPQPLVGRQVQLTAGTFSQLESNTRFPPEPIRAEKRHSWQLLGLWLDEGDRNLVVERDVFVRDERNVGCYTGLPTEVVRVRL